MSEGTGRPWWSEGLNFSCLRCGRCCGESPGTVCFDAFEERAMADSLKIGVEEFRSLYVWRKYGFPSLRELENYDCVFLLRDPFRCGIYESRPSQCKTFPFWPEVLRSRLSWDHFAKSCPGMNQGAFQSREEIISIIS